MTFLRKSGSLVEVFIKSLTTEAWCNFCSGSRSHGMILQHVSCQDPASKSWMQWFLESADQLLVPTLSVADLCWLQPVHVQHSQVLCLLQAFQNMDHFSTDSWLSLKHLCHTFICAALIALSLKAFWIIWMVSMEECSALTQNLMRIHCSTHSFWMWWPHSTHAHSRASTVPTD